MIFLILSNFINWSCLWIGKYIPFTAPIASLINFSSALSLATYHNYVISNVHFANISQTCELILKLFNVNPVQLFITILH